MRSTGESMTIEGARSESTLNPEDVLELTNMTNDPVMTRASTITTVTARITSLRMLRWDAQTAILFFHFVEQSDLQRLANTSNLY